MRADVRPADTVAADATAGSAPPASVPRVVVGNDGTRTGRRAVEYAVWCSERLTGRLEVVTLEPRTPGSPPGADTLLAAGRTADLVVVPALLRPAPGARLDAACAQVLARARAAVLVVHPGDPRPPDGRSAELVVGIDGSPASERALRWVDRFTRSHPDDLDCVTVLGAPEWVYLPGHRQVDDDVAAALTGAARAVLGEKRPGITSIVEHGDPVAALVRRSRWADLVVVGSHRHELADAGGTTGGHDGADDGEGVSVGTRCAAEAAAPVLVVH